MELYTSLIRLKQELNNGVLPPMTPLTDKAKEYLDPEFTVGMGALTEDPEKGLRCPVRGCGKFWHRLGTHLNWSHRDIGGMTAIRRLLDIPEAVGLLSRTAQIQHQEQWRSNRNLTLIMTQRKGRNIDYITKQSPATRRKQGATCSRTKQSVASKNLIDRCITQLAHKIIDVENQLGRSPSSREAINVFGHSMYFAIVKAFGSWNAAKAHAGLKVYKTGGDPFYSEEMVMSCFKVYYDHHRSLPTANIGRRTDRYPPLPHRHTIFRVFNTKSWPVAMRKIAIRLNIVGGRYGRKETRECVHGAAS